MGRYGVLAVGVGFAASAAVTAGVQATAPPDDTDDDMAPNGVVEADPQCEGESDGVLTIGTVLPETGNLAFLGPPQFAAAELAVQHINEAGGVLGEDVVLSQGDSGDTSTDIASQTVERHLADGVDVFIGAASSSVSFTFIDTLVTNCKIHFSPANTSPEFTTYEDDDLYFRTAPSDVLQGRVLAELMLDEGITNAVFMALQDEYGDGLLAFSTESFSEAGGEVVDAFSYDPFAASFAAEVDRVLSANAEAVVLIGFDESAQILQGLFNAEVTPDTTSIYLVDGNIGNALGEDMPEGSMVGIKGTLPAAELTADFRDQLLEVDPDLVDFSYGPEAYDAIVLSALAAERAGSDNPADIARNLRGITVGGEECTTFADCVELIRDGVDIAYVGPSGPTELDEDSERTKATFAILCYDEANVVDGDCEAEYRRAER